MEEKRIDLWKTLAESASFTVKYYKEMLGLIIPMVLIALTLVAFQQVQLMFMDNLPLLMLINIVMLCASLVSIYFSSRLMVAIIIFIGDRYIKKDFNKDYKMCYARAGELVWSYIGITLLYGLIVAIPVILMIIAIAIIAVFKTWIFPMIIIVISVAAIIYLGAKFLLAPYATVIEPAVGDFISYGNYLSKGFMGMLIAIIVVTQLIYVPLQVPNLLVTYNVLERSLATASFRWIAVVLTTVFNPFISTFMVMFYDKVVRSKMNEAEFKNRHPFLKQSVDNV